MKIRRLFVVLSLLMAASPATSFTQPVNVPVAALGSTDRISFMLKNTLGYHRMFRVEGPGIAYGFTMNRRETVPCSWPVGSKLYFSSDGETTKGLILTVTEADAGKTLTTGDVTTDKTRNEQPTASATPNRITFVLHNTSLLPRKIALISYEPGERGNGTNIFTILPKGNKKFSFPADTKLYLANDDDVSIVMSGKRIDSGLPFLVVKKEDAGRIIDLD
ncbi:hypothetical protein [Fibrella forsythiae]|uniref:Uncharacterized protein n=1 Tax=Fibrella forsythiae TaxID=2817061 RepID=A0ABS3JS52_9BACT|nr:hypothetical protein [Fibrella forsythiae]MBO0951722.1 hypothetical protein [Fibrella forsythiae]